MNVYGCLMDVNLMFNMYIYIYTRLMANIMVLVSSNMYIYIWWT